MWKSLLGAAAMTLGLVGAALAQAQQTIRLAITDVEGLESLQREFGPFKDAFEKASGLRVQFFPVSGRTAAVEAMGANQVDFVLTGPAEYVVFSARTKAQPVVTWQRPDYYSHVVVLEDGPVKSFADLKGKKVSFHEIGSTSRHLGPAQVLLDNGLAYGRDYEPAFVRVNVGLEALRRGDLAALGMNVGDIKGAQRRMPDLKLKVLGRSPELPDDVLVAAPTVRPEVLEQVRKTFVDHGAELMKAVVATEANKKYEGGVFKPGVSDRDFDRVRAMYRAVNVTAFERFIGN